MKKIYAMMLMLFTASLFAQGITTASAYFKTISEYYGTLQDYEVEFEINIDKQETAGTLSYKAPDLIRLDYTTPLDQVICFNGDILTVYLPDSAAVLQQQVDPSGEKAAMGTAQGLGLMSRYYSVAYKTGQAAEPLDEGSDEMVVKFVLNRKNASETFRHIEIAVNESTKLIRRIDAVTPSGQRFVFNFYNYKLNQGLPEQRFIYDAPSSANNYNNFLFSE